MIVEPKEYTFDEVGGYLTNDEDDLIIPKIAYKNMTKINDSQLLYTINNMAKIPFKINMAMLNYLTIYGSELELFITEHDLKSLEDFERHLKINIKKESIYL